MNVFFNNWLAGRRQTLRSYQMPRDCGLRPAVLLSDFIKFQSWTNCHLCMVPLSFMFLLDFHRPPQEIARTHLLNGDSPDFVKTVVVMAWVYLRKSVRCEVSFTCFTLALILRQVWRASLNPFLQDRSFSETRKENLLDLLFGVSSEEFSETKTSPCLTIFSLTGEAQKLRESMQRMMRCRMDLWNYRRRRYPLKTKETIQTMRMVRKKSVKNLTMRLLSQSPSSRKQKCATLSESTLWQRIDSVHLGQPVPCWGLKQKERWSHILLPCISSVNFAYDSYLHLCAISLPHLKKDT